MHPERRLHTEGSVMNEVISELLQRKEQQEEDLYFETLNREVIVKLSRQGVAGDNSSTAPLPPVWMARKNLQQHD